jgi:uncharacterized repeat protein (TIGR01451 family)
MVALIAAGLSGLVPSDPGPARAGTIPTSSNDTTFGAGSYIIDMGASLTKPNGLRPYGLIYELIVKRQIPVVWAIKDGKTGGVTGVTNATADVDFTATVAVDRTATIQTKSYKSGAFIIPAEYVNASVDAAVALFEATTVVDRATTSFAAPSFSTLQSWPRAALDAANGKLALPYFANAGVPNEARAYSFKTPAQLTPCDDIYIMPHADPKSDVHSPIKPFVEQGGYFWAGCKAVSGVENLNSATPANQLNFLTTTGMVPAGDHKDGTPPYTYTSNGSDPVLQFLNIIDSATTNGAEQIYMPKLDGAWRPTTKVLVWDDTQQDVPSKSPGEAAVLAYGRAYGVETNGLVMYEAGHSLDKAGSTGAAAQADVAAQRAFFNFLLLGGIERNPVVEIDPLPRPMYSGQTYDLSATITDGTPGYTYTWSSSCGGSFDVANGQSADGSVTTQFTAPVTASTISNCVIRLAVEDQCGRHAFDAETTDIEPGADMQVVKTANKPLVEAGGQLTYTLTVRNNGPTTALGVVVTDTLPVQATFVSSVPPPSSNVGGTYTWNLGAMNALAETAISVTVNVAAGTEGQVLLNTAVVSSTTPDPIPENDTSTVETPVPNPRITLTKTPSPTTFDGSGEIITYTFVGRNTGDVTLTGVTITDPLTGLSVLSCNPAAPATLAPNQTISCTATYETSVGDANVGRVDNTASITGTPPVGPAVGATASATVTGVGGPGISIDKSALPVTYATVGQQVSYSFLVSNTGAQTLTGVTVSDPLPGLSAISCPATTLDPAGSQLPSSMTCTAALAITQAHLDAGSLPNIASASGQPPQGLPVTATDDFVITAEQNPNIDLEKSASPATYDSVNQRITYSFKVTNTGNVTLTGIAVTDPLLAPTPIVCPVTTLAPLASTTCTADFFVDQADLDAGKVDNVATAQGTPPPVGGTPQEPVTDTDEATITAVQSPRIDLVKSASPAVYAHVGDITTYTFEVRNTGNVTLTDVTLTDPLPGLSTITCTTSGNPVVAPITLAPTQLLTCSATRQITIADLAAGLVQNTATASGQPPTGDRVSDQDQAVVVSNAFAGIELVKSASPMSYNAVGQVITYTFVVTNVGDNPLTGVTVTDPLPGLSALTCQEPLPATLDVDESMTCTATLTITQAHLDAGSIPNLATASGQPPAGPPVTDTSTVTVPGTQTPAISLLKAVTGHFDLDGSVTVSVGDELTYTLTATNTGNVTLNPVVVTDELTGDATSCASVAPGGTCVLTVTYQVTPADLAAEQVVNLGVAVGTPPSGPPVRDDDPVVVIVPPVVIVQPPTQFDVALVKTGAEVQAANTIQWTIRVTNLGPSNAPGPLTVVDDLPAGLVVTGATADAGWTCNTVGQQVICARQAGLAVNESTTIVINTSGGPGTYTNVATVTVPGDSNPANNTDDSSVTVAVGVLPPTGGGMNWLPLAATLALLGLAFRLVGRRRQVV